MGLFISRFRKKPSTEDQLKKIEDGLRKIEDYKRSTERKHKKLVASIIIYSAALYILACVVVFVWYLPESWMIRLGLLIPLVLVPVIVYFLKRLISKYFDSRMVKANEEYGDLQRKKKDIIDSVMETETFNKAKEILSKYAPEKLDKKDQQQLARSPGLNASTDLRKRNTSQVVKSEVTGSKVQPGIRPEPVTTLATLPRRELSPSLGTAPRQRLPQPVFPKERGVTDKLIEFMIGDGPSYRYALICSHCRGHNGMALKEEFPYMAFNCCYCFQYNPARSKRPVPPKLPQASSTTPALPDDEESKVESSEKEDGSLPESTSGDLKISEETDDLNGEKSDDDFQNLGFSEADQEFLRKVDPSPTATTEEKQGISDGNES
ncbi:endoplasmic reticulum junction formation protein lunapark-B isoform X2 [Macrosteles quadrilineatus]|uniref:endoplasmic reticulum junction formation protein lunapark-B isoform X2 n=1 Tax=Macrosteles quadrilineatus TaxID=74068 RepID=UPI0023E1244A|nr:endoplasmic reticulum junction formation protein lunapark-B isoform X2 [Macrosteles quadrilineatus]